MFVQYFMRDHPRRSSVCVKIPRRRLHPCINLDLWKPGTRALTVAYAEDFYTVLLTLYPLSVQEMSEPLTL